jgi:hypothetical protein
MESTTENIMSLPPLTIRKPETLDERLIKIESETTKKATETNQKEEFTIKINGHQIEYVVTPSVNEGRFYRLFYCNGKRVSKVNLPKILLETTED